MPSGRTIFAEGYIDWDEGKIKVMLTGPTGEVSTEIQRRARAVQRRAQTLAPVRTGELRSSISVNTRYPSDGAEADITAEAPYSMFVEFGRRRVTPSGKFLHWTGDSGTDVFARSAAAVPGKHFMARALDAFSG